ncbi:MAG TPA: response regulator [Desulfuromonadales bacterium]|nr:response regulator [Desulfuromonadales bacterium]
MRIEMLGQPQLVQEHAAPVILVVDDEEAILDLCARALKNYRFLQARDGRDALELIEKQRVDLVLTDVMMPVMNGLELLEKIKENDPDQLVIIMTGFGEKDVILRALKAKADDFIHKPLNLAQLKATVAKALERKRLRQELVQLRQLDRLKADFLGLVSHKLRTPTTSLSLFIQNLASGAVDPRDEDFAKVLGAMQEESRYLAQLIQDLLVYSDVILREEKLELGELDLKALASSLLTSKRDAAKQKTLMLCNDLPEDWPILAIDKQRMRFVLGALLDNAIKFTPAGGRVRLAGKVEAESVSLTVSDTGPGIAEKELPKVFEKFYQVDPAHTGQVRGFGLGLFYARKFVHDHDGKLIIESSPGRGTAVTISLPRPAGPSS